MRIFRQRRSARPLAFCSVLVALAAFWDADCGWRDSRSGAGGGRDGGAALQTRAASAGARDSSKAITRHGADLDRLDRQLSSLAARTERLPTSWTLHEEIAL